MSAVDITVQKTHRDRLYAGGRPVARRLLDLASLQRHELGAIDEKPTGHTPAQRTLDQRVDEREAQVVSVVPPLASEVEDVLEALVRKQADLGAAAQDDGVGGERRRVCEHRNAGQRGARRAAQFAYSGEGGVLVALAG